MRPTLFFLGGGAAGLAYYYLFGCASGSCPITASPLRTALYWGIIGLLAAAATGKENKKECNM